ncbi:hypothetical protein AgCh_026714 [Apium graveolens]
MIALKLATVNQTPIELSIKDFNVSANGSNSIIYFKLYLGNSEEEMQVHYDNLNLTFSYNASTGIVPVGNYTIPAFLQGVEKHTERKDYVVMTNGITWQDISKNVSSSRVVFRVDLSGSVKFKEYMFKVKSKRRKIMAWAKVEVDANTGKKISKKGVKLKHMINHHPSGGTIAGIATVHPKCQTHPCPPNEDNPPDSRTGDPKLLGAKCRMSPKFSNEDTR